MPFSDPIVAGGKLVIPAIESDNFVTTVSGWRIKRDGDAEFSDVIMRGTLTVVTPNGTVTVDEHPTSHTPRVLLQNNAGDNIAIGLSGAVPVITYETVGGAIVDTYLADTGSTDTYLMQLVPSSGDVITFAMRDDAGGFGEIVVNQEIISQDPAAGGMVSETWHNVAFQNGWSNNVVANPFQTTQYRLMPYGFVSLAGACKPGTTTDGTTIFTLPADYRPDFRMQVNVSCNVSTQNPVLQINPNGQCQIFFLGTATGISLDGQQFPLGTI